MDGINLLIAAPAYGGSVKTGCVQSLLRLQKELNGRGARLRFNFTSYAEVTAVRNLFGSLMVKNPAATHLLFVDTDMVFEPKTVLRLFEADKPLVGCFYAARGAEGVAVGHVERPTPVPDDGLVEADALGMGLCLIRGEVFRSMAATGALRRLSGHPFGDQLKGDLIGFFDAPAEATTYVSEDYAFCRRWRALCGGEVWALVNENVGHIGEHVYRRATDIKALVPR